jgi:hypothetical protein
LREQVSQFFCRRKHNLSARLPRLRLTLAAFLHLRLR